MPINSYNDDVFDLIQSTGEIENYIPNQLIGDYVRLSVFEQNGSFRDSYQSNQSFLNGDVQVEIDYDNTNNIKIRFTYSDEE